MFEILLALIIGVLFGILSGLLPGLHPNSLIPVLLGLSFLFDPLSICIILITAGVINSFLNYIPSVLLGAPESDNSLSALPGHRLLLQGRGYEAIKLTAIGGLGSILFAIVTLPIFAIVFPVIYSFLRPKIHLLLILVLCYMILTERGTKQKFYGFLVFALSGILGMVVLDWSNETIFPLLSGLFGLPLLFMSIKDKTKLPENFSFEQEKLGIKNIFSGISIGSIAGILAGLLPGIGSAQATVLSQEAFGKKNDRTFLIAISSVNASDFIYSLFALWLIGNPRSGIASAVGKLLNIGLNEILIFIAIIFISGALGMALTLFLSKRIIFVLKKVNYQYLCLAMCGIILTLIVLFSGFFGLLIALISLAVGLIPNITDIKRSHSMGCLMLPTIIYFATL